MDIGADEYADSEFIDRIYEASLISDLWPGVLRSLAEAPESREGVMVAMKGERVRWLSSSPAAEAFVEGNYRYLGGDGAITAATC